jgi:HEAT repeat protein
VLPLKNKIINLLESQNYRELASAAPSPYKIINTLISLSYDKKKLSAWRAIEAIGILTKVLADTDPESVRRIVGRLLWMIRDESGGIGWSSPEILGEIVRNNPDLCSDIAPIIVSFHEELMLTAGVMRAAGRIGKINNEMINYATPVILACLDSADNAIRGNAAYAAGEIAGKEAELKIEVLKYDSNIIDFYEDSILKKKTIGDIASEALAALTS